MTSFVLQGHICFISHLLQVTDVIDVQCIVYFLNDEIYIFCSFILKGFFLQYMF